MMTNSDNKITNLSPSQPSNQKKSSSWLGYVIVGILGNILVWTGAIAYLKYMPKVYTSEWTISLKEASGKTPSLDIPGLGEAFGSQFSGMGKSDPRSDYVYLFTRPDIIEAAAKKLNIPIEEFDEPVVELPEDSVFMLFSVEGPTPELAKKKSQVLYELITKDINNLRQKEMKLKEQKTNDDLKAVKEKLEQAERKLADYQATAIFKSDIQLEELSSNIESLRLKYLDLVSQEQALNNKIAQISKEVEIPQNNVDTYALQADKVYQEYFNKYGVASTKFTELSSQLGSQHPTVLEAKSDLDKTVAVLQERGALILGRKISLQELISLSTAYLDPQTGIIRGQFFQNLATSQAEQKAIIAQKQELERQINELENRFKIMREEQRTVSKLRVDVDIAKSLLTSTSAELELTTEADTYGLYPPFDLLVPPKLPDPEKPTSPKTKIGLAGALAGSFLITTGLILLWWEKKNEQGVSKTFEKLSIFDELDDDQD